jgi:hypothetical protein
MTIILTTSDNNNNHNNIINKSNSTNINLTKVVVVSGIQRSVAHAISSLQARPLSQVGTDETTFFCLPSLQVRRYELQYRNKDPGAVLIAATIVNLVCCRCHHVKVPRCVPGVPLVAAAIILMLDLSTSAPWYICLFSP